MADTNTLSVEERLALLEQSNTQKDKQIQALLKVNNAIAAKLSNLPVDEKPAEIPKIPDQTFNVNGRDYKFVIPHFRVGGEIISGLDALNDPELLAELVEKESGVIQEVL